SPKTIGLVVVQAKRTMRKFILVLAVLVLAGLAILYFTGNLQGLADMFNPRQTTIDDTQCAYVWATQPLPDISAKLQQRLEKQEVLAAEVNAAAYGENCVLADGSVARFLARQTDLYFKVPVTDIEDKQTLGELTEGIINFVQDIPADTLVGTQS
ncbi:MAG TPA: hypothetical protein DCZ08_13545, partial [Anaerolineaceae bacterium]|nr:hypothetical protein [Anaerolineaceae bacterium]